jgi:hypothetical protein
MSSPAGTVDQKTGRLALLFCQQCFRIRDARIVDDRSVVAPNLDFDFTNDLSVIGVVNQMCLAYGLSMEMEQHKRNWLVTIHRLNDHVLTASTSATNPILRRAILQVAIHAHTKYILPFFGDA